MNKLIIIVLISCGCFLLTSCSTQTQQQKTLKYPRKPVDNPERKSGPAMLFYESAEEDADPNSIIVIPPDSNTKATDD
jgi:hypothetical protein